VWVEGSRKRRNFDDWMIPKATFDVLRAEGSLLVAAPSDAELKDGVLQLKPIKATTPPKALDLSRAAYACSQSS